MFQIEHVDFDFSRFELEIDHVAYAKLDSTWFNSNVSNPYSELFYVKSGTATFCYNGKFTILKPQHIYLVPSGCTYDYFTEGTLEKIYFCFYINTLEHYDLFASLHDIYEIDFEGREYDILCECVDSKDYFKLIEMKLLLYRSLQRIAQVYHLGPRVAKQYSESTRKVMSYIQKHTSINCTAALLADKLFLSVSKLRRDFKTETGISIGKFINDMVFFKAKQLLCRKDLSIAQISQELGFCDQFYFSKRFKQIFSITPTEYRKKIWHTGNISK